MAEGRKQSGSSLASDLFGAKDSTATPSSSSSSSALFSSIFPHPPSKGVERELLQSPGIDKETGFRNLGVSDKNTVGSEDRSRGGMYYQDQKVQEPCHYSSSIYYGAQDVYSRPQDPQNPESTFSKDNGSEDDTGSASRGNWWQGSLYY